MKIRELFESRTKKDIIEIGNIIWHENPDHYTEPYKAIGQFLVFLNECEKCKQDKKETDSIKYVIIMTKCIDFNENEETIPYKDDKQLIIDYDKLKTYFIVNAINIPEFVDKQDIMYLTNEELNEKNLEPFYPYGISLIDRSKVLNYEIAQLCFDKYDINRLAAEIYWEMTYFGIDNEKNDKKTIKIIERFDSVQSKIKLNDINDTNDNKEKENVNNSNTTKVKEDIKKINKYSEKFRLDFYKEYYDKYKSSQIKSILDKCKNNKFK